MPRPAPVSLTSGNKVAAIFKTVRSVVDRLSPPQTAGETRISPASGGVRGRSAVIAASAPPMLSPRR